ncbi:hypothetical protein N0V93_002225 [Gnomoniopsis smithogilvyi]|uniref:DUF6594 domain-containing protein n=1 Tax=Gnomoniopsis smithogilvyi TaxID=1191159 RepID=A0A9W8YUE0_9PEZI|nr:hypothetical protein N0V93_002225 [Gnomoniopsis smithogilvyi]
MSDQDQNSQHEKAAMSPCHCSHARPTELSDFDLELWERTVKDCRYPDNESMPGFMNLVTNRHRFVPRWLETLVYGEGVLDDTKNYGFSLNLADVHRMYLRILQGRLIRLALSAGFDPDFGVGEGVLTELGPAMRDYVQALRDLDYMGRFSRERHDPFVVSSERDQDKWALDKLIGIEAKHKLGVHQCRWLMRNAKAVGTWEVDKNDMRPIGGTRGEAFTRAWETRTLGALVAAAFLLGPMWALVLNQDIYLHLGVTTGCIVAFGLVMVVALKTLDAVFASTLAYAAVLTVLVGNLAS